MRQDGALLLHVRSNFCSMKITEDVRQYAEKLGVSKAEALEKGLAEKAEFKDQGW